MDIGLRIDEIEERRRFFSLTAGMLGSGDYVEFGSCGALTISLAWQEARKVGVWPRLWAFDSFKGFPATADADEHPQWRPGTMAMDRETFVRLCDHANVPQDAYTLVEGFYEDTLNPDAIDPGKHPSHVRLAYINCGLYSSAKLVMTYLRPRLRSTYLLAFDNYYCWWKGGICRRAQGIHRARRADAGGQFPAVDPLRRLRHVIHPRAAQRRQWQSARDGASLNGRYRRSHQ